MKKIKLYRISMLFDSLEPLNPYSLFDEGEFYKEWIKYINFNAFEKTIIKHLESLELKVVDGYYFSNGILFYQAENNLYEKAPLYLNYYIKNKKEIDSDYYYSKIFLCERQAQVFIDTVIAKVLDWLVNLKRKV